MRSNMLTGNQHRRKSRNTRTSKQPNKHRNNQANKHTNQPTNQTKPSQAKPNQTTPTQPNLTQSNPTQPNQPNASKQASKQANKHVTETTRTHYNNPTQPTPSQANQSQAQPSQAKPSRPTPTQPSLTPTDAQKLKRICYDKVQQSTRQLLRHDRLEAPVLLSLCARCVRMRQPHRMRHVQRTRTCNRFGVSDKDEA